tara:strand:- start:1090 stop:1278 length:189 start_codon:yes stop_codon:yes gene_type:complete
MSKKDPFNTAKDIESWSVDLKYYKNKAEKDYDTIPTSVLRYIQELEINLLVLIDKKDENRNN